MIGGFGACESCLNGLGRGGGGILIVRAEVTDEAALFFGGALVVEGDEARQEFLFNLGLLLGNAFLKVTGSGVEDSDDVGGPLIGSPLAKSNYERQK
jgi:hypothetical protein